MTVKEWESETMEGVQPMKGEFEWVTNVGT